jgi:hypothetical protein
METTQYRLQTSNPCETVSSNEVTVTVKPAGLKYPDIRIRVCPDASTDIKLSKYLDTVGIETVVWSGQIPNTCSSDGVVSRSNLASSRTYTFTYTVTGKCIEGEQKRKLYLEVLKNNRAHLLKDTIAICHQYAEAVQINQLFGLEDAQGELKYPNIPHITESKSPSYYGAVIMNGKAIYEDDNIQTGTYHGLNNVKMVEFIYEIHDNDKSCLKAKEYKIVIVLTENIIN